MRLGGSKSRAPYRKLHQINRMEVHRKQQVTIEKKTAICRCAKGLEKFGLSPSDGFSL